MTNYRRYIRFAGIVVNVTQSFNIILLYYRFKNCTFIVSFTIQSGLNHSGAKTWLCYTIQIFKIIKMYHFGPLALPLIRACLQ